ncbi:MAG: BamA/TamA family outer membrane protein [Rhizobacter sp.]|nr:BamA/TamA family outer membrane protein [Ferruginibacter sp.]
MKKLLYIFGLIFFSACSVQKYLPEGERLYKGAEIKLTKDAGVKQRTKPLKSLMKSAISPKPNKFFLGQPWKVWWWYKIGEPKREKGFKAFLRNKLGEPPVLSSRVKTASTAENIQSLMENNGYFKTTVQGDTTNFRYFTKAIYIAQVKPQYSINEIKWVTDSSPVMKAILRIRGRSLLQKGDPYSLAAIKAERERLDLRLKTRGYYYFNPDYLMAYADSTIGDRKVNLYLNIKKDIPADAKKAFSINQITVYPNYSLNSETLDTSDIGSTVYEGIHIQDTLKKYKPSLFARSITYDTGSLYNSRQQNASLNRLISLGTFKFVKNRFEKDSRNDRDSNLLNVYYYLTPAPKKSLQGQVDGFTKDNNYMGSQVSLNYLNRNAFRGGEQLTIKTYGGFETSFGDSLKGNNNLRLGGNIGIRLPRYAIPFFDIRENNFYQPNTSISLGYEWYRKNLFYSRNAFTANYEFSWKQSIRSQFRLAPISLAYIRATGVTDSFYKQIAANPSLLLNIYDEVTLGTTFNYTFTPRLRARNKLLYTFGIDLSGNVAGLIKGAKEFRESKIFGAPFAQFVKLDLGANFTKRLSGNIDWANRLELGIGMPYNNSSLLPFAKQYTIGGASSIRGFSTRSLGPGTYKPTAEDQRFYQIIGGDFRLLANTELRVPFSKLIGGAVFVDAGNIWTKDTIVFGPQSKLTKNWFKEIAVASGVGLRVDLTFLLLRFDLGIPLRKPYLPDGGRWVFNKIDFGSGPWRRENLVFNIAIGLPF